jgi:hypothetical protein
MPTGELPKNRSRTPESAVMLLQIDGRGHEQSLQFSAVIRNLGASLATLEVTNPWTIMNWETLKGRKGCLRLLSPETGESTEIRGTVTWARYTVQDQENGHLNLGLKLADHDQLAQKLLFEHITHTSADIKGFWNRWDQTRQSSHSGPLSIKMGFAATALLLGALAMQFAGPKGFKLFGWVLWFCGTLVVANQALRFWKERKASL